MVLVPSLASNPYPIRYSLTSFNFTLLHVDCLRSSTKEVYEAFHCSGAFTPGVRQRAGGLKALVLDAETNPCCKQAVAQCRGDDGNFPMNPSYYTSSWLQGASGRRLSSDGAEDEFLFETCIFFQRL